ncbi:MAG: hypothetical protein ABL971_09620 [Vicinamibacterales bacterium]
MTDILTAIFSNNSLAGTVALLIVAASGYFLLELFVEWRRAVRENRRQVQHYLRIVQRSALPLLHELRKHIILPDYLDKEGRLENLCFRIVHLLASIRHFNRNTYHLESSPELEAAEYFLANKIPMMLRGSLYRDKKLNTETQEVLAGAFSLDGNESPFDFTIAQYRKALAGNADFRECCSKVEVLLRYGSIDVDGDIDLESPQWRTYATLCHLFLYVADFYMNSTHLPTWEEYRVYCAAVAKAFNSDPRRAKGLYLYDQGDLSGDYVATFTSQGYSTWKMVNHFGLQRLLRARGRRYARRHGKKLVESQGLVWKELKRTTSLSYGPDRREVRRALSDRIWNVS